MSATTKIAVGVAGGYLLGRTKKLRLALTLGSLLAGRRLMTNQKELVELGLKTLGSNPEVQKLRDDVSGRLREAARDAALGVATSRMERLTESLRSQRADEGEAAEEEQPEDEAPEEEPEQPEDEAEDQGEEEPEEEPEPRPAKKAAAKKAPAKKAPAKKAPAKKSAAKKTAAKSTSARARTGR